MNLKRLNFAIDTQLHTALKLKATNAGKGLYEYIIEVLIKEVK